MKKDVIVALDFENSQKALAFLDLFQEQKPYVKVGMELFYSAGPEIITEIKKRGHNIFLDLKLHDIPNTVEKTMAVLAQMGIDMCNLHAAGTKAMMEAAMRGLNRKRGNGTDLELKNDFHSKSEPNSNFGYNSNFEPNSTPKPLLIAVTQLTSTDQKRMKEELGISKTMEETVLGYAKNAADAGLDGVVCSPLEAPKIHQACGSDFLTVTPGIRPESATNTDDQVRFTTPAKAGELGSDYIVVGRPITQAKDPVAAYRQCVKEFLGGTI